MGNTTKLSPSTVPALAVLALIVASVGTAAPGAAQFGAIGLSGVGGQRFPNDNLIFYLPQTADHFARVLAIGDFNGDGAGDLAAGIPHDNGLNNFEIEDCGAVVVRYGVPGAGLAGGAAATLLNQVPVGSPDPAEVGDNFGGALAACDFDGDGFDDLAVGIPNEDFGATLEAGAVEVYYGSPAGLGASPQLLTQATPGLPGEPEPFDLLGFSLACGHFDGDALADLAIGAPWESLEGEGAVRAGVVIVVDGSPAGLDPATGVSLFQGSVPIQGTPEDDDWYGWALAVGNFNSDGHDDLAIGAPGEDGPAIEQGRGAVAILFGNANGFPFGGNFLFTESAVGGTSEDGDQFGYALAAGDFDGNLFTDLAIGAPFEDVEGAIAAGGVALVYFGPGSPVDRIWTEDDIHGVGSSEEGDRFGFSLAGGDFDRDGRDDLAIGEPGEFVLVPADGMVTVVMGSPTGITNARRHGLTAGRDGNPGVVNQANRNYGHALATGDFDADGYADLAIGAPNENDNQVADVGALVVLYGALFANGFDNGDPGYWSSTVP